MKKFTISFSALLILLLLINSALFSQKLYVEFGGGYGIGNQKTDFTTNVYINNYMPADSIASDVIWNLSRFSFGQGVSGQLSVGTFLSSRLGFELTGFYNKSKKFSTESNQNDTYSDGSFIDYNFCKDYNASSFGFKPTVIVKSDGKNIRMYVKAGAIFSFTRITEEVEFRYYTNKPFYYPTWDQTYKFEYKRKLNIGITASLGMEFDISDDLSFFTEISYNEIAYIPKSGEITEFKDRGIDELNDLTVSERQVEFVDSYSENENNSDNIPTKMLKETFSFSNIAIMAGFKINLLY